MPLHLSGVHMESTYLHVSDLPRAEVCARCIQYRAQADYSRSSGKARRVTTSRTGLKMMDGQEASTLESSESGPDSPLLDSYWAWTAAQARDRHQH